ncbi:hypothetical protein HN371_15525 [Candidatus Poribacteria bacterium]|nr:hypothetical protein [Candidatus Poribacteria bacterium]MBT5537065.1 hypothetical protein [Candidatus Poribacteria bacterium]MBT5712057.1 hypothetical protein [Candidatus Poribacteria bacterium]MBT7803965.1 hypothetical protein [Candidatus Poribacteria bacterium]
MRELGSRRELFVDDWLIDRMDGVELRLGAPTPREVAIVFDAPWEGNVSAYVTVFRDVDLFRMYYRGANYDVATETTTHAEVVCYAESDDGVTWRKPELGLVEFDGSRANNIVWDGIGAHNFAPFRDANPAASAEARYKAVASGEGGLYAFRSPDGLRWELMQEAPIITEGAFDSQNLAFWDSERGRYVDFHRGFRDGVRDIMTTTSSDFLQWREPVWLDWDETPPEHLYTNAIVAYPRAPHLFLGFPKRYVPDRTAVEHPYPGVSDGVFMSSRDGARWNRWREAFLRPGPMPERWVNRNNMTAWGIVTTAPGHPSLPDELSIYVSEGYYAGDEGRLRRHTLRQDGFVSAHADARGGELVTRPLTFEGTTLRLNYATSAAGSVRAEVQDVAGAVIAGFALDECAEIYGDHLDRSVEWAGEVSVGSLSGQAVRLRFRMEDADLYAVRFAH